MRQLAVVSAMGLGLLSACEADHGDGQCGCGCEEDDENLIPLDLDEPVPGEDFTPQEVLDAVTGMRQGTLVWHGSGAGVEVEPSSGETDLSVQLRYTGGDVLYEEADVSCDAPPGLFIHLTMDFASSDGAFADTWPVVLAATAERVFGDLDLIEDELQGTFSTVEESDDPHWSAGARLIVEATAESSTGAIEVAASYHSYDPETGEGLGGTAEPHETATFTATPVEG